MKKFAKALGVLSALALLGAGFVSCSDDDGEENKTPSLKVEAASAVSVAAGAKIDVTLTATLTNDSFAGPVDAGESLASFVTITPSDPASFGDDLAVTAAEAIAEGATSAKVKVSVTTTAAAKSGTITVTIKADALKSGKDLTSNTVAYTITAGNGGGGSSNALLSWSCMEYSTVESKYNGTIDNANNGTKEQYTVSATTTIGSVTINADASNSVTFDDNASTAKLGTKDIWGYCQLGARSNAVSGYTNGKSIVFEAPAGAKKITILSKSAGSSGSHLVLATGENAATNAKEADIDNAGDSTNGKYTTTVYEFTALAAKQKFCLYNYGSGKSGLNVKGILVE